MSVKLHVVVAAYNALPYLVRSLKSIAEQEYTNYELCIVDDCSTQSGQRDFIRHMCRKHGWRAIFRKERKGGLASRIIGVRSFDCAPQDVIVFIDGDDWLFDKRVFSRVAAIYEGRRYDLTYGQHIQYPQSMIGGINGEMVSRPCPRKVVRNRTYRDQPFSWFHLWTMRHFLWDAIKVEDLKDRFGEIHTIAFDSAFLYPLLEMSGKRKYCFSDLLYVHNRDNPINESKCVGVVQAYLMWHFRQRKPYEVHPRCR